MCRLPLLLLSFFLLTNSQAEQFNQHHLYQEDDPEDILSRDPALDPDHNNAPIRRLALRSTAAADAYPKDEVAEAVKEWAGLKATHLLDSLSFHGILQASDSLQAALFGSPASSPPPGSQQPAIFLDFVVSHFEIGNRSSGKGAAAIRVQGTLRLRRYFLGSPSWRVGSVRNPRTWNPANPRRSAQSVPVDGLLSVRNRELSSSLCLSMHYNKKDNSDLTQDCKIELVLKYPEVRSIRNPAVLGSVESSRVSSDPLHFDPAQIYGKFRGNYMYSKVEDATKVCDGSGAELVGPTDAYRGAKFCEILQLLGPFWVSGKDCNASACGPFAGSGDLSGWMQRNLLFDLMDCSYQNGQLNGFLSLNSLGNSRDNPVGVAVLAFEGSWSPSAGRFCLMACHNQGNVSDPDCSIHIQIQIARTVSLRQRSVLLGRVMSLREGSDARYFAPLGFQAMFKGYNLRQAQSLVDLVYNYTVLDQLVECIKKTSVENITLQGNYPVLSNTADLEFNAQFKIHKQIRRAFVKVLTVGSSFESSIFRTNSSMAQLLPASPKSSSLHSTSRISFSITMDYYLDQPLAPESWYPEMSAEGIYDATLGKLCLIGCRMVDIPKKGIKSQQDCQLLIKIQYPPVDPTASAAHPLSGTISSLRNLSDALYFEPIEIASGINFFYMHQAQDAIWRKDFEVFLSMITLSIAAIIVILQLAYTKAHPETVPYMSLVMLVILTLSPMIPLVLNFEAIFSETTQKSPFLSSGGWIEVKEVLIRIITMVLFLLQLRLLHLAWAARHSGFNLDTSQRELSERNVLKVCLPIYILGAILSIFLQWLCSYSALEAHFLLNAVQQAWWAALKGYTGVIVDFFLLPQVVANVLWGSQEKPLSLMFYGGMTCLRSLPHFYDAYRAHKFLPQSSYIYFYASPESDYFSLVWDIVIPCGGLLLAFVIFLQQKFGGRCIVPSKWRGDRIYQKISPPTT